MRRDRKLILLGAKKDKARLARSIYPRSDVIPVYLANWKTRGVLAVAERKGVSPGKVVNDAIVAMLAAEGIGANSPVKIEVSLSHFAPLKEQLAQALGAEISRIFHR